MKIASMNHSEGKLETANEKSSLKKGRCGRSWKASAVNEAFF